MTTIDVDPESLRRADLAVTNAVADADSMLGAFEAELAGFGEPWGADDLGSLIGEVYTGAYAMAMNCYNSNLDTMDGYATRLTTAATQLELTDEQAAQQVRQPMDNLPDLPL
jgi:hypothetical protein